MTLVEQFEEWTRLPRGSLQGWEAAPVMRDGEVAGIAILHGFEIHFAVAPAWRGRLLMRRAIQEFLGPLLDQKGFLTTRVISSDETAKRFVTRLGFEHTVDDGRFDHYMLSALPYSKEI